jgi:hypothetical protein
LQGRALAGLQQVFELSLLSFTRFASPGIGQHLGGGALALRSISVLLQRRFTFL